MSSVSPTSDPAVLPPERVCTHGHVHGLSTRFQGEKLLEKIAFVAIAIFSVMTSPLLFAGSVAVGFAIHCGRSLYNHTALDQPSEVSHGDHSACGSSFLERLTGVKLPRSLELAASVGVLMAHIEHHNFVFVPIVGVITGLWLAKNGGKEMISTADICFRKVVTFASELKLAWDKT